MLTRQDRLERQRQVVTGSVVQSQELPQRNSRDSANVQTLHRSDEGKGNGLLPFVSEVWFDYKRLIALHRGYVFLCSTLCCPSSWKFISCWTVCRPSSRQFDFMINGVVLHRGNECLTVCCPSTSWFYFVFNRTAGLRHHVYSHAWRARSPHKSQVCNITGLWNLPSSFTQWFKLYLSVSLTLSHCSFLCLWTPRPSKRNRMKTWMIDNF